MTTKTLPYTKNIFNQIKKLLIFSKKNIIKTVNSTMVYTYFEIGRIIIEDEQKWEKRAEYNTKILKSLSLKLTAEFWKWFSITNLQQMRNFYTMYKNPKQYLWNWKQQTLSVKSEKWKEKAENSFSLSWSHYVFLMRLEEKERIFYETESKLNNWSLRELKRNFDSSLYERIILSKNAKWVLEDNLKKYHYPEKPKDILKDPYILEFLWLDEKAKYSESDLEEKIIDNLEHFLLELGKWFTFVWRQQRFTFDEQHFFVDLVFYNRLLKCFVVLDLKIWKIKHQDLWQMQMYVNYYDRFVKTTEENPTIWILLSKDKNEALVEITLPENSNIFSKEYKLYLPTKEELKNILK